MADFNCVHQPRQIYWPATATWPAGEGQLSPNGNWWTTRQGAGGLEAVRLEHCPGCGLELWGLPA